MNQEYDEILIRLKDLEENSKQNNTILKRIERRSRLGFLFSGIKWFFIIGLSLGAFYYIRPFLEEFYSAYEQVSNIGSFFNQ